MIAKWLGAVALGAALWTPAAPIEAATKAGAPSCDRTCLAGMADAYMAALQKRDPRGLPWAAHPKFTENNIALPVGDGLWGTIDGLGAAKLVVTSPADGAVAWFRVVRERDVASYWGVRMKVVGGKMAEVETLVSRKAVFGTGPYGDPDKLSFDGAFAQTIPVAKRLTREKLIAAAEGYFDTLQKNNGTLHTKFAADCSRQENGSLTAGDPDPKSGRSHMFCGPQFRPGYFAWDDRVRDRRYTLVDPEHGLVLATVFIDHSGKTTEIPLRDGTKIKAPKTIPDTAHVLELFKVDANGAIARAETVILPLPYRMPSPWSVDGAPTRHPIAGYGRP